MSAFSPLLNNGLVVYPWQTVSVAAAGSASPTGNVPLTIGGSGTLQVYVVLGSGVTGTVSIENANGTFSLSLSAGLNEFPVDMGDIISGITFSNSGTSASSAIVKARVVGY